MGDRINDILRWAKTHPSFDTSFVEDVDAQDYPLTDAQEQALENICERFRIPHYGDGENSEEDDPANELEQALAGVRRVCARRRGETVE